MPGLPRYAFGKPLSVIFIGSRILRAILKKAFTKKQNRVHYQVPILPTGNPSLKSNATLYFYFI